jgi:hypothetical protein
MQSNCVRADKPARPYCRAFVLHIMLMILITIATNFFTTHMHGQDSAHHDDDSYRALSPPRPGPAGGVELPLPLDVERRRIHAVPTRGRLGGLVFRCEVSFPYLSVRRKPD